MINNPCKALDILIDHILCVLMLTAAGSLCNVGSHLAEIVIQCCYFVSCTENELIIEVPLGIACGFSLRKGYICYSKSFRYAGLLYCHVMELNVVFELDLF